MTSRLITYIDLEEGEFLDSYVHRLGLANHYTERNWLHTLLSIPNGKRLGLLPAMNGLDALANFAMLEPEQIVKSLFHTFAPAFYPVQDHSRLHEDPIWGFPIWESSGLQLFYWGGLRRSKFCPLCIRTNPARLAVWSIRQFTICPVHHVLLIDACPKCDGPISMFVAACGNCGNTEFRGGNPVNDSLSIHYAKLLSGITSGEGLNAETLLDLNLPVEAFNDSGMFIRLLWAIAVLGAEFDPEDPEKFEMKLTTYGNGQGRERLRDSSVNNIHWAMRASLKVFMNWPGNFIQFLERIEGSEARFRELQSLDQSHTKRKSFIHQLWKVVGNDSYRWFWSFLTSHILGMSQSGAGSVATWLPMSRKIQLELSTDALPDHSNAYAVASRLGVGIATVIRLGNSGALSVHRGTPGEDVYQWQIPNQEVQRLDEDLISTEVAADVLGFSITLVRMWARTGLLPIVSGPTVDCGARWRFLSSELSQWRRDRMTTEETLKHLHISRRTLEGYVQEKKLKPIKGHTTRPLLFWRKDIDALLKGKDTNGSNEADEIINSLRQLRVSGARDRLLEMAAAGPPASKFGAPRVADALVIDAVLWLVETKRSLSKLPKKYPSRRTVSRRLRDWFKDESEQSLTATSSDEETG